MQPARSRRISPCWGGHRFCPHRCNNWEEFLDSGMSRRCCFCVVPDSRQIGEKRTPIVRRALLSNCRVLGTDIQQRERRCAARSECDNSEIVACSAAPAGRTTPHLRHPRPSRNPPNPTPHRPGPARQSHPVPLSRYVWGPGGESEGVASTKAARRCQTRHYRHLRHRAGW